MEKKLERDESNKMLAGVAAGLAEYLNIDVTWVRVLFICLVIFGFAGIWIYIILWIAVPAKAYPSINPDYTHRDYQTYDSSSHSAPAGNFTPPQPKARGPKDSSTRYVVGIILIALGSYFLLDQFFILPEWISIAKLWPVVFIAIGLVILFKPSKRRENPVSAERPEPNANDTNTQTTGEEPTN